ncbi:MAG: hypothetical protein IJ635_01320 [Bacteroidaceae bacterium]|nr:hypothetical protein [Bacteroidaceae bacterium]
MERDRILGYVEMLGETLVVVGAIGWLPMRAVAPWLMAVGVVLFAVGRFVQTPFYQKYSERDPKELTLRRLYHQRVFGMVALILSAMLMFLPQGFYSGMYVGPSSWLVLFVIFVVIEVYTTFRISAVDKG